MPVFQFKATDAAGRGDQGMVHAPDLAAAISQLNARGMKVESIEAATPLFDPLAGETAGTPPPRERPKDEAAKEPPPTEARPYFQANVVGSLVGGVPLAQLHFFFKQLGVMMNAGINPVDALDTLSRQTQSLKLRKVIQETSQHVLAGRPMTAGFQRYPEVFSPLMVSMVRVGERSGLLAEQCKQLSEYLQRDMELRNLVRRETAYPKLVIGASAVIIVAANAVISAVGQSGSQQIMVPWLIWAAILGVAVGSFLFVRLGLKNPVVKLVWDQFLLLVPGIGKMAMGFAMAKFGRAFGALYKCGVPFAEGLTLAADACGNEALRARIYPAVKKLEEGCGITETLRETRAFSPIVLDMTRTGEMTGNLDEMLEKASEFYEDEGQTNARKGAMILGVVALLVVGIYVLYVAMSFYGGYGQHLQDATG